MNVEINNKKYFGLLDSGASISILGAGCEELLDNPNIKFVNFPSYVKVADNGRRRILGYIIVSVSFGGKTAPQKFFLVPDLGQPLYLGMDFWRNFDLKINISIPEVLSSVEVTDSSESLLTNKRHDISPENQKLLNDAIALFPSYTKNGLGRTTLLSHEIDVGGAKPTKQRYYPVSPAVQAEMYKEIDRMIELDVIEESSSPWCSPMAVVRKKNGKTRLCLDARKINDVTKKDAYPLPIIDGLLSRLDTTRYISALDLKDAFWQIPLTEESKELTAFTIPGRPLYQFKVMPFGLCNAPQALCRLMDRVIPHQLHDRIFVYLDDLLVTSATFEEHLELLKIVAKRLEVAGLTINVEKSKFNLKEVEYLGYVVGEGTLRVNPDKVSAIASYPRPSTVRQVRSFLGVTGWYRRFIANYSTVSAPLTDLLKKSCKVVWTEKAEIAFKSLKQALISAPVLRNPDFSRRFFIQCDASTSGVGSVLFQKTEEGEDHPICFFSQKLNGAQRNYSVTELECFAAVLSVKKFRAYIEGHPFTIITDHSSLKWLMNQRDLSGRLARWSLKLQGFDFNIEHVSGSKNNVPDALSRVHADAISTVGFSSPNDPDSPLHIDMDSPHFKTPEYVEWSKHVLDQQDQVKNLTVYEGKIYINQSGDGLIPTDIPTWKLVVPAIMTQDLIRQAHLPPSAAHVGVAKVLDILRRYFYWKGMAKDVHDFVVDCEVCKTCKPVNFSMRPTMGSQTTSFRPFQRLYVDFLGPYPRTKNGNCHVFIVLDQFSRFVMCQAQKRASALGVINFLSTIFDLFGVPESILSDNGSQFVSNILSTFLNKFGIHHIFTPKHSPQANASERVNRSLLAAIRSYIQVSHKEWDSHLDEICGALRHVKHDSTNFSPHFLVFGQHKVTHGSSYELLRKFEFIDSNYLRFENSVDRLTVAQEIVMQNLRFAHDKHENTYNLRSRQRVFDVNQKVFVRNFVQSSAIEKFAAKLAPKFVKGTISRKIGNVAYEVVNDKGKVMGVYHAKDIRI